VAETAHRYDMIFIDAFLEEVMPTHMNTRHFFVQLRRILHDDGCLATNSNVPTTDAFNRLVQALSSTFESNIILAHSNTMENARIIISGSDLSLGSISSQAQAIREAERLELDARFQFSFSRLISLAYRGPFIDTMPNDYNDVRT
jgi:spermidine synthase